jgi:hypothetical protein
VGLGGALNHTDAFRSFPPKAGKKAPISFLYLSLLARIPGATSSIGTISLFPEAGRGVGTHAASSSVTAAVD